MNKIKVLLIAVFVLSITGVNAQLDNIWKSVEVLSGGDMEFLFDQEELNVEFTFERVNDFESEEEFIEYKTLKKKEKKAKKWIEKYNNNKVKYKEAFIIYLNKRLQKANLKAEEGNSGAKYTLIVCTEHIERTVLKVNGTDDTGCRVDYNFKFVETENKDNIVAEFEIDRLVGIAPAGAFGASSMVSLSPSIRIKEAYADAGRKMGSYIKKTYKKRDE